MQAATLRAGSIPACAGEPAYGHGLGNRLWVYPRVCGGTSDGGIFQPVKEGLSPRVRGNLFRGGNVTICYRVYPRVCGGTKAVGGMMPGEWGLSPRVRGNLFMPCEKSPYVRSIPACAGEPHLTRVPSPPLRVYPRVCGGTAFAMLVRPALTGLSPRVRGNLFRERVCL